MFDQPNAADGLASLGICIAYAFVNAGEERSLDLPIVGLPTGTQLTIPLEVICGVRPGPRVWLTATVHGEELNGLEIIRRVLQHIDAQDFAGVLVAAPVMNVLGFLNQTRTLPDGTDLNRAFPGSKKGSMAERIAHFFMEEIVSQCSFGIDLHSGANNRLNPPQIRADLDDPQTRRLAEAFAAPITMNADQADGTLRHAAVGAGNRVLLFEGGEPLRFNDDSLQAGSDGVLRVLKALDMLPESFAPPIGSPTVICGDDCWVKAPRCGIFRPKVQVNDDVKMNDSLGSVADVLGDNEVPVLAPFDGLIIGTTLNPFVAQGGGIVHIAKRVR